MAESTESFAFLVLCRDLLLSSKILATARANGVAVKQVRTAEALTSVSRAAPVMIVDLNQAGFHEVARDWKQATGGRVIGFAGHADIAAFEAAKADGFDQMMARGAFVGQLGQLIR